MFSSWPEYIEQIGSPQLFYLKAYFIKQFYNQEMVYLFISQIK